MDMKEEEFLKRLLSMFNVEAKEHLTAITSGLLEIENGDPQRQNEIIETVFRESHSLKGAARSVNLTDVVTICQTVENVLSTLKRKELLPSPPVLDLLHRAVGFTERLVNGESLPALQKSLMKEVIGSLESMIGNKGGKEEVGKGAPGKAPPGGTVSPAGPAESDSVFGTTDMPVHEAPATMSPSLPQAPTIRVSAAKLDDLLLLAEELLLVKLATTQRVVELKGILNAFSLWRQETAKRSRRSIGPQSKVREASADEMFSVYAGSFEPALAKVIKDIEADHRSFSTLVDALLADTKKTLMLPFQSALEILPGLARNLSREAGKETMVTVEGESIEIDRRILEEIKDPLIHIVRNCVDHGIETPAVRQEKNKPPRGSIKIVVSSRDGMIQLSITDDGAGIDVPKLKMAAAKAGLLSQENAKQPGDNEYLSLAFISGITTNPIVTDLSGRGLGLTIVKEKVERLCGTVELESRPDMGTTLKMTLPLTLATYRGVIIRVENQLFVCPSANVLKVMRVRGEEIRTLENRESIIFDGKALSLVRLGEVLQIRKKRDKPESVSPFEQVVVLTSAGMQIAFLVDEILHEREVLIKPLGKQLQRVRNFSGATILGTGKVVPILNVSDLMISSVKISPVHTDSGEQTKSLSLLVAEDSITARTLLRTILESAGYNVRTAVDGADAFMLLNEESFDLLVSDVDMPRLNGFDLTAKIRKDAKLADLPVVLVTALESAEDKQRGIEVGANAYIVKSSFDQNNLLEVVKRLV